MAVAAVAVALIAGARLLSDHIARDRWNRPASELTGTQFQFGSAGFHVFNETGHEVDVKVSAGRRLLFERRLNAQRAPETTPVGRTVGGYQGPFPYETVVVNDFDTLTRYLELEETEYLRRKETIDLEAIPASERNGPDFLIRVTSDGFVFRLSTLPK